MAEPGADLSGKNRRGGSRRLDFSMAHELQQLTILRELILIFIVIFIVTRIEMLRIGLYLVITLICTNIANASPTAVGVASVALMQPTR